MPLKNQLIYLPRFFVSSRDHRSYRCFELPRTGLQASGSVHVPSETNHCLAERTSKGRKDLLYCIVTTVILEIYTVLRTIRQEGLPLFMHLLQAVFLSFVFTVSLVLFSCKVIELKRLATSQ